MREEETDKNEITEMLHAWQSGNRDAADELMTAVYSELKRQARRYLRGERPGHTLQTTALIHEAYIRLIDQSHVTWQNRAHFFGIAAQMMKRILLDHAKKRHRVKRGGVAEATPLDETRIRLQGADRIDLLDLDEALAKLSRLDKEQAKIVELRYFGGLSIEETAEVMGVSPATIKRTWSSAKAWLRLEMTTKH